MTYSGDLRWRAIVLVYIYGMDSAMVGTIFGSHERSIRRWISRFEKTGSPCSKTKGRERSSKWPREVILFVEEYVKVHPCFYIEELQEELRRRFQHVRNVSTASICRALRFDLNLTRKRLTKRARESAPQERREYAGRLLPFYSCPEQLVFVDETSKDGRCVWIWT